MAAFFSPKPPSLHPPLLLVLLVLCFYFGMKKRRRPSINVVPRAFDVEATSADENVDVGNGMTNSVTNIARASSPSTALAEAAESKNLVFFERARKYALEDLLRASANLLGKGTFGTSYKAALNPTTTVAVKRLKHIDVPEIEFKEKIEAVGKMDHPNVVPLRAYYLSEYEKLLVYDYMPMGSLSALLHVNRVSGHNTLNWETRLSIAVGVARGVQYIHSTGPEVSHGRIKSSNILLAKSDHACVSDHGLFEIIFPSSTANWITGYHAPEVTDPRKVSQKADVYSFGILLLELLTGKAPIQAVLNEDDVDLARWVQSITREEWTTKVFDQELLRGRVQIDDEMVQLLQIALDCSVQYPERRPTMSDVVARMRNWSSSVYVEPRALDMMMATPTNGNDQSLVFFERHWTFALEDLLRASANLLGKGTFGTSYEAALNPTTTVVVKRLKHVDVPEIEFKEKIEAVGKMDHPNVLPLRAYHFSEDEKLLVYDYMPMGSLSAQLLGDRVSCRSTLNWETRLSFAVGVARGVQYIHSTGPEVSHGRIKSSNILLAKSDHACVSDHGLFEIIFPSSTANWITGYHAPEVTDPRKVSQKADVYSFGILLLELLTGKAPVQAVLNEDDVDLARWVQSIAREEWTTKVFDQELLRDRVQIDDAMVQLLQIALDCSVQYPERRPTMSEVLAKIEVIQRASLDPDEV